MSPGPTALRRAGPRAEGPARHVATGRAGERPLRDLGAAAAARSRAPARSRHSARPASFRWPGARGARWEDAAGRRAGSAAIGGPVASTDTLRALEGGQLARQRRGGRLYVSPGPSSPLARLVARQAGGPERAIAGAPTVRQVSAVASAPFLRYLAHARLAVRPCSPTPRGYVLGIPTVTRSPPSSPRGRRASASPSSRRRID
jgi:hypothetical protein